MKRVMREPKKALSVKILGDIIQHLPSRSLTVRNNEVVCLDLCFMVDFI